MCNMSTEMGCKTSYIQPDAVTMEYLHNCVARPYKIYETDTDFQYAAELTYDVSKIRAQVAAPSSVDNVFELENMPARLLTKLIWVRVLAVVCRIWL